MKRSDFLAIIPALSAIPLIGKEIIQKPDRIEIYQPEEVKNFTGQIKNDDTYLAIVRNGQVLGTAYITNLTIESSRYETTCRDDARTFVPGPFECKIEATVLGPVTSEMAEGVYEIFHNPKF